MSQTHRVRQQACSYRFCAAFGVCARLRIWSVQASTITARLHHHIRMKSISAQRSGVCSSPRIWSVQATAATAARHYRSQAHHRYSHEIHFCRSRLAGEHVVGSSINVTDTPRSPASRLLQVLRSVRGFVPACESGRCRQPPAIAASHYGSQAHHHFSDEIHFCRSRLAGEHVV
jgi:hypothetical protein